MVEDKPKEYWCQVDWCSTAGNPLTKQATVNDKVVGFEIDYGLTYIDDEDDDDDLDPAGGRGLSSHE